jgi:hypothetical protein
MTTITETLEVSEIILQLGRWISGLQRLADDVDFAGWRHPEEAGALLQALRGARLRAEEARFLNPKTRASRLHLIISGLPARRLSELLSDDGQSF